MPSSTHASSDSAPSSSPNTLSYNIVALLGLLTAIGPVSTDMYLPAFPAIEQSLGSGNGSAQMTLATWFIGLSLGQFCSGPLSDRFGRRQPLLIGMMIYTLASAGCAMTSDFYSFCFFRFLAGIGGAVGAVIPRAIVRDVATGRAGARIMTQLMLIFGVAPVLAPSLGGAVLMFGSWRWIFWIATIYGLCSIIISSFILPDTLPISRRNPLDPAAIIVRYARILREPNFLLCALISSAGTFVTFAYIGAAPIVFEQMLHFTPSSFALFFGVNAACFILANQISGHLIHRFEISRLMIAGITVCFSTASLGLFLATFHIITASNPFIICLIITGCTASLGFVGANASVLAFHHHGSHAGSASALLGTLQFAFGAVSGGLMGWLASNSLIPMMFGMGLGATLMVICATLRQRLPDSEK
ncbi:MAG: multidrug effflux MFS transporter [Acetobacter sp.]|jgi:DHA1 family bicyclomycin/chloramphenicol resistance-like MFS transporter